MRTGRRTKGGERVLSAAASGGKFLSLPICSRLHVELLERLARMHTEESKEEQLVLIPVFWLGQQVGVVFVRDSEALEVDQPARSHLDVVTLAVVSDWMIQPSDTGPN